MLAIEHNSHRQLWRRSLVGLYVGQQHDTDSGNNLSYDITAIDTIVTAMRNAQFKTRLPSKARYQ